MELLSNGSGNWDIYRLIMKETSEAFIVRIPKTNSESKISSYLNNYRTVKNLGLSTLIMVERYEFNGKTVLMTEDLNYLKDRIYVTHNSLHSDSRRIVNALNPYFTKSKQTNKWSEYEEFRYRNKLKEISNLVDFLHKVKNDLRVVSQQGVFIGFDSYFFGTQTAAEISEIDYKIVDLDDIRENVEEEHITLYYENVSEFERALHGFIRYFVDGENQVLYLKYLTTQYQDDKDLR